MARTVFGKLSVSGRALSGFMLAGIIAAGAAAPADAQDPLTLPQGPEQHVVQEGETLWALAARYLGDPLLWPEIYRINTMIIEDPHWIFPGEVLRLMPGDHTTVVVAEPEAPAPEAPVDVEAAPRAPRVDAPVVAAPPPPPPVTTQAPTVFARQPERVAGAGLVTGPDMGLRAVRRGDFYAAGFLTEREALPWASVLGAADRTRVAGITTTNSAMLFQEIRIEAPAGTAYFVGDSLLVASVDRQVAGWGGVVVPAGIARVTTVSGSEVIARILSQFSRITDGQFALPLEPFRDPGAVQPRPVAGGMVSEIVDLRNEAQVPNQFDVVFIAAGRTDGVAVGDVFEILKSRADGFADAPPETLGMIQIVHVRERSASGILTQIYSTGIEAGVSVRLIRKMPS